MSETTFAIRGDEGREVCIVVRQPNQAVLLEAARAMRRAYRQAIRDGVLTDADARPDQLRSGANQAWVDVRQQLAADSRDLTQTGVPLEERRQLALAMRESRRQLRVEVESAGQNPTAEVVADQAGFEVLVAACAYGPAGRRLFAGPDDYRRRAGEPFARRVAEAVAAALYEADYSEPAEERFLREHGLAA